jgi:hypothetical protein
LGRGADPLLAAMFAITEPIKIGGSGQESLRLSLRMLVQKARGSPVVKFMAAREEPDFRLF